MPTDKPLAIVTFNVNGLRAIRDYYLESKLVPCASFSDFLNTLEADIICVQEHKVNTAQKLDFKLSHPTGYTAFYSFPRVPKKIGYSGVATFVKVTTGWLPTSWSDTLIPTASALKSWMQTSPLLAAHFRESELKDLDNEGRIMITDHFYFLLLNIYFPNDSGPDRHDFRRRFYYAVQLRCLDLIREHGKSLIIAGDVNITYHPLDHCEFSHLFLNSSLVGAIKDGLSDPEVVWPSFLSAFYENPMRRWLAQWLFTGTSQLSWRDEAVEHLICVMASNPEELWVDCFRVINPFESVHEHYTCWNTVVAARGSNHGTRIDYIFTSGPLFDANAGSVRLIESVVMALIMGSDHCPVRCNWLFSEHFVSVNEDAYTLCQLNQGNIPHAFGRVDQLFTKRDKSRAAEPESALVGNKSKVAKNTILDYFGKAPKAEKCIEPVLNAPAARMCEQEILLTEQVPNEARTSLAALFSSEKKRPAPLCRGHSEACILHRVNKTGPNQGRQFYLCSRPVGVSGDPSARCNHFEWYYKDRKQDKST